MAMPRMPRMPRSTDRDRPVVVPSPRGSRRTRRSGRAAFWLVATTLALVIAFTLVYVRRAAPRFVAVGGAASDTTVAGRVSGARGGEVAATAGSATTGTATSVERFVAWAGADSAAVPPASYAARGLHRLADALAVPATGRAPASATRLDALRRQADGLARPAPGTSATQLAAQAHDALATAARLLGDRDAAAAPDIAARADAVRPDAPLDAQRDAVRAFFARAAEILGRR